MGHGNLLGEQCLEAAATLGTCLYFNLERGRRKKEPSHFLQLAYSTQTKGREEVLKVKCLFLTSLLTRPPPLPDETYRNQERECYAIGQLSEIVLVFLPFVDREPNKFESPTGSTCTGSRCGVCIEAVTWGLIGWLMDQWGCCVVGVCVYESLSLVCS